MLNIPRLIKKIFKSDNDKELDRLKSLVIQVNNNEDLVKHLKDDQFPNKTMEFKQRIKKGEKLNKESIKALRPYSGISASKYEKIVGTRAVRNLKSYYALKESDFK